MMSEYKEILYEKQRGGVLITLNRPEALNAITRPMLKEFHHALDSAAADPETRAAVITGAGFTPGIRTTHDERPAARYRVAPRHSDRHERRGSDELLERRRRQAGPY